MFKIIRTHTVNKKAGHVLARHHNHNCINSQYINPKPTMLRVIMPGLARYHSAVFLKCIIISGLGILWSGYCASGKLHTTHARLARQGAWLAWYYLFKSMACGCFANIKFSKV
ncbi:MAG: hypothetical protein AB9Q18_12805, partial [Candidatus Reddybacter sp.]